MRKLNLCKCTLNSQICVKIFVCLFCCFPFFFPTRYFNITTVLILKLCLFQQHTLISQSAGGNPTFLTDYLSKVYSELCSCVRLTLRDTSLFIPTGCPSDQKPNFRHVRLLLLSDMTPRFGKFLKLSKIKVGL